MSTTTLFFSSNDVVTMYAFAPIIALFIYVMFKMFAHFKF